MYACAGQPSQLSNLYVVVIDCDAQMHNDDGTEYHYDYVGIGVVCGCSKGNQSDRE